MIEFCKTLLLMSAVGSGLALFLLLIKPITKRFFGVKWQYYIWLLVLIAMVIPIKFSITLNKTYTPPENAVVQTEENIDISEAEEIPVQNNIMQIKHHIPDIPKNAAYTLGYVWLAAAVLILLRTVLRYAMFFMAIHKSSSPFAVDNVPKRLSVRKTDLLDAPLVVGLVKPVLYLPQEDFEREELEYIMLHELTHYKRNDILYKWFTMLVSCMHWFNPFVYIVSRQIDEDCEISCDYEVCKNMTDMQKDSYMNMILNLAAVSIGKKRPLTTQMASGKKILERRFTMITKAHKIKTPVKIISVISAAAMLLATAFVSSALANSELFANDKAITSYVDCDDDAVISLTNLKVISGYDNGSFNPEGFLTRAEFAKIISLINGGLPDEEEIENEFSDVSKEHWASDYILHCNILTAISGYEDGTFKPNNYVSYAEVVKVCLSITGYRDIVEQSSSGAWYEPWLETAMEYEFIDTKDANPERKITRLEAANLIYRTINMPICQVMSFNFSSNGAAPSFVIADGKSKSTPLLTLKMIYFNETPNE